METTTDPLSQKLHASLSEKVRRRVEETPDGPKEVCEMRRHLEDDAPWVEIPPIALSVLQTLGSGGLTVRQAILSIVSANRDVERTQTSLRETQRLHDLSMNKHVADIERIGQRLIEESNDRGWCNEFDEIIEEMNVDLNVPLPVREKDFELSVTFTVTGSRSVTVRAASLDDAVEQFKENIDDHMDVSDAAADAANYGNFEIIDIDQY
jgi:hypothetical protein